MRRVWRVLGLGSELTPCGPAGLDPESKGWTISNSEKIRAGELLFVLLRRRGEADDGPLAVHNSFARSDPFHLEESQPQTSEDAYHFITYLPSASLSPSLGKATDPLLAVGDKLSGSSPLLAGAPLIVCVHRYELDGLKHEPVSHGVIPGGPSNWTALAREYARS